MFFIVPQRARQPLNASARVAPTSTAFNSKRKRTQPEESDLSEQVRGYYPKRIARACNRCRLKKTRCTGGAICERCKQDGVVCVKTVNLRKTDHQPQPEYVHLVESQRDQLAHALHTLLKKEDSKDSTRLKALLNEMGVGTQSLQASETNDSHDPANSPTPSVRATWDDIFDCLHDPQLEELESFCAATPLTQGFSKEHPSIISHHNTYISEDEFGTFVENLSPMDKLQNDVELDGRFNRFTGGIGSQSEFDVLQNCPPENQEIMVNPANLLRNDSMDPG